MANRSPLSVDQRHALWARHNPAAGAARGLPPRRRPPRLAYDNAAVAIRISHPGGGHRTAAVYAHDLSTGGVSFLYPGFLHAGTAVSVALRKRAGGEAVAHGGVAWCRHVGGLWHGVGVAFTTPLVPADFVDPAGPVSVDVSATGEVTIELKPDAGAPRGTLAGRVLYLEDQELDQGLFLHTVRKTRLKVTAVGTAAAAVAAAAAGDFDVACVDADLGPGQPTAARAMAELRAGGFAGRFVVVGDGESAGAAEADALVVAKPYTPAELLSTLCAALGGASHQEPTMVAAAAAAAAAAADRAAEDVAPLHSQLAGQDGIAPLLRTFCDRAAAAAADLDHLMAAADRAAGTATRPSRPPPTSPCGCWRTAWPARPRPRPSCGRYRTCVAASWPDPARAAQAGSTVTIEVSSASVDVPRRTIVAAR